MSWIEIILKEMPCSIPSLYLVYTPKLLDGLNYKSKGEDNGRRS
jgi:hypothetical protein